MKLQSDTRARAARVTLGWILVCWLGGGVFGGYGAIGWLGGLVGLTALIAGAFTFVIAFGQWSDPPT